MRAGGSRYFSSLTGLTKAATKRSKKSFVSSTQVAFDSANIELRSPSSLVPDGSSTDERDSKHKQFRDYFANWRRQNTVSPIAYDKDIVGAESHSSLPDTGKFSSKKVSIVGCGQVGMACAISILNQDLCGSLSLIDANEHKLQGEAKDLIQGSAFHQRLQIQASSNYSLTQDSDLIIVTAGVAQKPGESRLSLVERNVRILQQIIPNLLHYSPAAPICIVSNPCDVMTAVANKMAKHVPVGQIFGSGTCLDSSRLRSLIAQAMDLDAQHVHGYVLGEHGDSSLPVWSSVRIGALPLVPSPENATIDPVLTELHKQVVHAAGDVIALKGYTNWAIGLTSAYIAKAVLNDARSIMPLSTCVRGLYGIEEDVYLSVPCSLSASGIQRIAVLPLTTSEQEAFRRSAEKVWEVQKGVWDDL